MKNKNSNKCPRNLAKGRIADLLSLTDTDRFVLSCPYLTRCICGADSCGKRNNGSFSHTSQPQKWRLDWFTRFCTTHLCAQIANLSPLAPANGFV